MTNTPPTDQPAARPDRVTGPLDCEVSTDLAFALRDLAARVDGGMPTVLNAAALLTARRRVLSEHPDRVRVIAINATDPFDVVLRDVGPGGYLIVPVAPAFVSAQERTTGTAVITIRESAGDRPALLLGRPAGGQVGSDG